MKYFSTLPKLLKTDASGNSMVLTNIMARASMLPAVLKSSANYYEYDIQDGDTPEIIAHKYYNDVYRYWMVLFTNQIIDPQWNWPLDNKTLQSYIDSKYPEFNVNDTVYDYQKIITKLDLGTNTTTIENITISEDDYNDLLENTTSYNLPTGTVVVSISKKIRTIYDYELEKNEGNRKIKLLKSLYADQLETELKKLMAK